MAASRWYSGPFRVEGDTGPFVAYWPGDSYWRASLHLNWRWNGQAYWLVVWLPW